MEEEESTMIMVREGTPPEFGDSLIRLKNRFGSKIVTLDRLAEITPFPDNPEDPEEVADCQKEFERNVDLEISRDN